MTTTEGKNFSFPLFSLVLDEAEEGAQYMCLHQEVKPAGQQFCGYLEESFDSMIQHLSMNHDCHLRKQIDYCKSCQTVFDSKFSAIIHGLTHILEYQEDQLLLEINNELTMNLLLAPFYDIIKKQREIVMNHQLFDGEDPFTDDIDTLNLPINS